MEVTIRSCEPAEIPAVVQLSHELFREDSGQRDPFANVRWPLEYGDEHFASHLSNESSQLLVAATENNIVGYLLGYMRGPDTVRVARVAELESMYVISAYRHLGIGCRLFTSFTDWALHLGADRISVTAHALNEGAIRFYEREGFAPWHLTLERSTR